jgi:hypothetical protein
MMEVVKSTDILSKECEIFSRHLIGKNPDAYVIEAYRRAHRMDFIARDGSLARFDKLLVLLARMHPFMTRLVDVYTAVFFRRAHVRKKLIILLGILESSSPGYQSLDIVDYTSRTIIFLQVAVKGCVFAVVFGFAVLLLLPAHVGIQFREKWFCHW